MTAEREVDLVVRTWLDEGVTVLPQHVLNATLYEVAATRQRGRADAWYAITPTHLGQWAAVAAALMIGLYTLGSYIVTARPSPAPSPSSSVDASTSPLPFQLSGGSALDSTKRYVIAAPFPAQITFSVPGGWYYGGFERAEAAIERHDNSAIVWFGTPSNVYADACRWQESGPQDPPIGGTVFDLAEALRGIPALHPSAPEPIRFGSFSGLRMTMRGGGSAPDCDQEQLGIFVTPASYWPMLRDAWSGASRRSTLYILDVEGSRLVIELQRDANAGAYVDDELQQIVDSIVITPR